MFQNNKKNLNPQDRINETKSPLRSEELGNKIQFKAENAFRETRNRENQMFAFNENINGPKNLLSPNLSPFKTHPKDISSSQKIIISAEKFTKNNQKTPMKVRFKNDDSPLPSNKIQLDFKNVENGNLFGKNQYPQFPFHDLTYLNNDFLPQKGPELPEERRQTFFDPFAKPDERLAFPNEIMKSELVPMESSINQIIKKNLVKSPERPIQIIDFQSNNLAKQLQNATSIDNLSRLQPPSSAVQMTNMSSRPDQSEIIATSDLMMEVHFILKVSLLHFIQFLLIFGISFFPTFSPNILPHLQSNWWIAIIFLVPNVLIYLLLLFIAKIRRIKSLLIFMYIVFTACNTAVSIFCANMTSDPINLQIMFGFLFILTFSQFLNFLAKLKLVSFFWCFVFMLIVVLMISGYAVIFFPSQYYITILGSAFGTAGYGLVLTFDYAQIERCTRNSYYSDDYFLAAILLPVDFLIIIFHWARNLSDNFQNSEMGTKSNFKASIRETFKGSYKNVSRHSISNFN